MTPRAFLTIHATTPVKPRYDTETLCKNCNILSIKLVLFRVSKVLKKYYLALLLLIFSCNAAASIWGDIGGCVTDPCNCGQGDRTETWNAGTVNEVQKTFKPGSLCPPWNKSDGRDEDTCLLQYDHPSTFIGFYLKRCAEAAPSSNYFSPKIRIRIQSCNAAACWSQSATLNWDGDCVLWPTGYGVPLTRICARVAIPETLPQPGLSTEGNPADPGYTEGKHLNKVGYVENDEPIIGVDGTVIPLQSPKLCAYSDPGLVNLVSDSGANTDAMDWNPNSQPLHKTTELSPIAKVLEFLVKTLGGTNLPSLLGNVLDMMGAENSEILKVFKTIFNAIGQIFNFFPSLIIDAIKIFGSLNSAVDNYSFGCVQLPLGPYPPPFCSSLNELTVSPLLHNICSQKNSDGITFNQSSTISPCVVSNVANNVINNTVRVSFNNLVPLCSGASPDLTTCIELKNIGPFSSAQGIHAATAYTDLIKACSSATGDAPCINTNIPLPCSVTANGCNQGFRIVYSQEIGSNSTPNDYYISDLPDCGTEKANNSTTCQKIWGVNIGEFIDISVKFPMIQEQGTDNLLPLQQIFSLKDNNNKARNFYASIVNKATDQQSPADICVFESASLVDCQARVDKGYSLVTYKCGEHAGLNCPNNTYYTPQFIASVQIRDDNDNILDETNSIITPLSVTGDPSSTATETVATLAGYEFSSSVAYIPAIPPKSPTDKYIAMPFSGPNSLNQFTIYGKYKNNEKPYDASGQVNPNAVYLKYLEYINGKYIQGGTHACLMPKDFQHCLSLPPPPPRAPKNDNTTEINCILAKLTESDTVDCQTFKDKSTLYPNLGICQGDISSCTQGETIAGKGSGITIYKCPTAIAGITTDCYTNNDKANTPVCVLSRDYQNRIDPAPDKGLILNDSQHYTIEYDNNNKPTYNLAISDVRDKTSQELNLCVSILGICPAITTPSNDSGNATWPETDIGDLAKGTCKPDWITIDPNKPLERYCLSNFDSKTVAFEKLAPDVGCRESKGITIEDPDSNFPSNVDSSNQYDNTSKIGSFTLNKEPQDNGAFPEDVIITQGLYHAIYEFEIDSIIDDIEYFQIQKVAYDDCVLIKINDQKVLSEPTDVNDFNLTSCNGGKDQGHARVTTNVPIDVKSKLKQGKNTISFQLGVIGKGGLYYYMEYRMRR